ncbi:peroxiredoxin family protein [Mucilaginibacter ginsenosidivorax]|uniref:TlpA family protein disulfide reductase n=1 Tax=Mucilaginibacter ginsenosidivorax TaxID=862126 RepID=A0A5B8W3M7_9SPHI|nr:TlpA disulfide reductase family protein [Mucilaginibacter ginsenosidivorax]QEC77552.1 TlpA family protein disulfide reductase [Mucilaginibacter ginsenosidivorax]
MKSQSLNIYTDASFVIRNICLLIMLTTLSAIACAQDVVKTSAKTIRWELDKNSVVKDSAGKIYPMAEWNKLMVSRKYSIWPADWNNINNQFIIVKGNQPPNIIHDAPAPKEDNAPETPALTTPPGEPYDYMAAWPKPNESAYFKVGEEISPFTSHDINGNRISLKDLRGKVVVLNFFFIGCPGCMQEVPELNDVVARYKGNDNVVFVSVSLDVKSYIKKFMDDTPFNYQIIAEGGYLAKRYGIELYPTNLILDKTGKVALHWVGRSPSAPYWMKKTIDKIL